MDVGRRHGTTRTGTGRGAERWRIGSDRTSGTRRGFRDGETEVVEKNSRLKAVARCLGYCDKDSARGRQVSGLVLHSRRWRELVRWREGTHGEPVLKQQIIEDCDGVDGVSVQPADGRWEMGTCDDRKGLLCVVG